MVCSFHFNTVVCFLRHYVGVDPISDNPPSPSPSPTRTFLQPEFYNNPSRFLLRTCQPMASPDDSAKLSVKAPFNTSTFWVSNEGCHVWATLCCVVAQSLAREISLESTCTPPFLSIYELKNLIYNVYDHVEEEVGSEVMAAALGKCLSHIYLHIDISDLLNDRLPHHLPAR